MGSGDSAATLVVSACACCTVQQRETRTSDWSLERRSQMRNFTHQVVTAYVGRIEPLTVVGNVVSTLITDAIHQHHEKKRDAR